MPQFCHKPAAGARSTVVGQVVERIWSPCLPAPFARDGTNCNDKSSFSQKVAGRYFEVWQGLLASPRSVNSRRAKLCTNHCRFAMIQSHPQLPLTERCMRCMIRYGLHDHALPFEMARRLPVARFALIWRLCPGMHVGDERHYVFECPAFHVIHCGFQHLSGDSHGACVF